MEKETPTLPPPPARAKSPKTPKTTLSTASHVSGNNNPHQVPPRSANNNTNPTPVAQNNRSVSRSKSPGAGISHQERSKLAREKFQSLLTAANKVSSLRASAGGSGLVVTDAPSLPTTPSSTKAGAVPSILGPAGQVVAGVSAATGTSTTPLVATTTPATTSTTGPPPSKSTVTSAATGTPLPASKTTVTPAARPQTPKGHGQVKTTIVSSGPNNTRASTIATSAKSFAPKFNQYPNIDPRTFPKPISTTNPILVRPPASKSIFGIDYRSKNLRSFVEKAMTDHKVFSCVGVYPAIKNALKKRGWIEKTGPINVIRGSPPAPPLPRFEHAIEEESDTAWVARNLRDYPPDFIWVIRRDNIDWKLFQKDQVINRYPKAWFTTKVGLSACLQQMHWFSEAGFSETFFPRCYRLCMDDERLAFQEDYRLTACMSYCRYFVEAYEKKGANSLIDPQSRITPLSIDFASRQLGNYIRMRRHEDIDWLMPPNFMSQHWDAFIHQYIMVVHEKKKIRFETVDGVKMKYETAKKSLTKIAQFWPQHHLDGVYNMWICKPGARSRGKGIVIMNSLEKIMDLLNHGNAREANWVVQKYMERPMLVYKTKFDMRQWFVITDWSPLTLWFYKESYIRFCTKPFVLEDFHESVHLCNNAIQCRYQNAPSRDSALPDENMWDNYTFQAYLKTIGKSDQWAKIYKGMQQAIIGVLLASQESVEARRGCFELYGADFMLSEDFNPWLIEINSCPCMASTTSITARMCAQALEDVVKVVIDRRTNRNADTGMFEMVYRQPLSAVTVQQFTGHDLVIHGKKLTRDIDWPGSIGTKTSQIRRSSIIASNAIQVANTRPPASAPQEELNFSDLLQKLRMKNTQLFQGYVTNNEAKSLAAIAGVETQDRSLTGVLLSKMRGLGKSTTENKLPNDNEIIPGMKRVYPVSKPTTSRFASLRDSPDGTLSHLSKYFEENSNTFANLVRIGKEISDEENKGKQPTDTELSAGPGALSGRRPLTFGPDKFGPSLNLRRPGSIVNQPGNPYLPRSETAKTPEEVRQSVNATSTDKYNGKEETTDKVVLESSIMLASNNDNDTEEKVEKDKPNFCDESNASDDASRDNLAINLDALSVDNPLTNLFLASSPTDSGSETGHHSEQQHQAQEKFETIPESDSDKDHQISKQLTESDYDLDPTTPSLPVPQSSLDPDLVLSDPELEPKTVKFTIPSEGNFHIEIQDILNNNLEFPSSSSDSESNSDSEDDDPSVCMLNFNPSLSLSSPRTRFPVGLAEGSTNRICSRRRHLSHPAPPLLPKRPSFRAQSRARKFPCHRISLRPCCNNGVSSSSGATVSKKSLPTFPVSRINLKLV